MIKKLVVDRAAKLIALHNHHTALAPTFDWQKK